VTPLPARGRDIGQPRRAARWRRPPPADRQRARQEKTAVTDQQRADILALGRQMEMDDLVAHTLGFWPNAR